MGHFTCMVWKGPRDASFAAWFVGLAATVLLQDHGLWPRCDERDITVGEASGLPVQGATARSPRLCAHASRFVFAPGESGARQAGDTLTTDTANYGLEADFLKQVNRNNVYSNESCRNPTFAPIGAVTLAPTSAPTTAPYGNASWPTSTPSLCTPPTYRALL